MPRQVRVCEDNPRHEQLVPSKVAARAQAKFIEIALAKAGWVYLISYSPDSSTAIKAFCGISTEPIDFMRFFPSFCLAHSLRLRVMSPP
jgi:hypothetical protein